MEEDWWPIQLKLALDKDNLPVVFYNENETKVESDLNLETHLGIRFINISQESYISITTEVRIIVFDLSNPKHSLFLRKLFLNQNKIFYTANGIEYSFKIYDLLNINIGELSNWIDLTSFDFQMSLNEERKLDKTIVLTYEKIVNRKKPCQRRFNELISYWLSIQHFESISENQLKEDVNPKTFNIPVKNLIKKTSALTRALGKKMFDESTTLMDKKSKSIFKFGIISSDEKFDNYSKENDKTFSDFCKHLSSLPSSELC